LERNEVVSPPYGRDAHVTAGDVARVERNVRASNDDVVATVDQVNQLVKLITGGAQVRSTTVAGVKRRATDRQ
jgi:hypothetical protein